MKKFTKACLVLAAVFAGIGITFGVIGVLLGGSYQDMYISFKDKKVAVTEEIKKVTDGSQKENSSDNILLDVVDGQSL